MTLQRTILYSGFALGLLLPLHASYADGIVSAVVNSPLASSGLVRDARTGVNVWLQSDAAPGLEFMDPKVVDMVFPPAGASKSRWATVSNGTPT